MICRRCQSHGLAGFDQTAGRPLRSPVRSDGRRTESFRRSAGRRNPSEPIGRSRYQLGHVAQDHDQDHERDRAEQVDDLSEDRINRLLFSMMSPSLVTTRMTPKIIAERSGRCCRRSTSIDQRLDDGVHKLWKQSRPDAVPTVSIKSQSSLDYLRFHAAALA